jgi:large subunit ribosomal protein L17
VEKLVTLSRTNNLTTFRQLLAKIKDQSAVNKLLNQLATRYAERPGGYLRIYKAGFRYGDMAPMAIIEFVDRDTNALGRNFDEQHPTLEIVA